MSAAFQLAAMGTFISFSGILVVAPGLQLVIAPKVLNGVSAQ